MTSRIAALVLLMASAISCASTVIPWDGDAASADGRNETGVSRDANPQLTRCGRDTVHDGDRCERVHDSCLTNMSCGGYTACDCGVDALWHCQTVSCSGDGGR